MSVINPDTVINGIGYVACVRDPTTASTAFNQEDLFQAVAFIDPTENLEYDDMRQIVERDNRFTFFTNRIDKFKSTFTWQQALDRLSKMLPKGGKCQSYHLKPITFGDFVEMAYSNGTLSDSAGYNYKLSTTKKTPMKSFMPPLMQMVDDVDVNNVAREETIGDNHKKDESYAPPSEVVWRQRALLAESSVARLEAELLSKDNLLLQTKAKLTTAEDAKVRFCAQADLADTLAKEYKINSSTPIIAGLKEELKLLPQVHDMLKGLVPKFDTLGAVNTTVQELRKIAVELVERVKDHDERVANMGDDPEMQSILGKISKVVSILEQFGFSLRATTVDVPHTLGSLAARHYQAGNLPATTDTGLFKKEHGNNNNTQNNVPLLSHPPPLLPQYQQQFSQGHPPPSSTHFQFPHPQHSQQIQRGLNHQDGPDRPSGSKNDARSLVKTESRFSDRDGGERSEGNNDDRSYDNRNGGERSYDNRNGGEKSYDRNSSYNRDEAKRFRKF